MSVYGKRKKNKNSLRSETKKKKNKMAFLTLRKYKKLYIMEKIRSYGIEYEIYYAILGKSFHLFLNLSF